MLEGLAEKLQAALKKLAGKSVVDEAAVNEFIKELQRALISADVDVKLVFELSNRIKEKALKTEQLKGLTTKDHVLKTIYDELVTVVGEGRQLDTTRKPIRVMMVGLFGAGKTTTTGKIARWLKKRGLRVGLIAADIYRPAAKTQLKQIGEQVKVDVYTSEHSPEKIVAEGVEKFKGYDAIIVDTAGRNALDGQMLDELHKVKDVLKPTEVLLTIGADLGQEAGRQAREFAKVGLTGVIVTKMEGTAKGGGAITSCATAGVPVVFVGTGEKLDDLDVFEPKGFVSRILGWGDIGALLRKAEEAAKDASVRPEDLMENFNMNAFYKQLQAAKSMGPLKNVLQMLGGGGQLPPELVNQSEKKLKKYEFIINSMTKKERENPDLISSSRITRIAKGSGVKEEEVKDLIKHFKATEKMIRMVKKGRVPRNLMKGLGGFKL